MKSKIEKIRKDYSNRHTLEDSLEISDPIVLFECWFNEALNAELIEPNAMSLGTANEQGEPSVRVVLLKAFDKSGFIFYTNYQSQKAKEIASNPKACALFWWDKLG